MSAWVAESIHINYPDEYRFLPADDEHLEALALATGGRVAPPPKRCWPPTATG